MVKIFMVQHEEGHLLNYQSATGEYESFEAYLEENSKDESLPIRARFVEKHIDEERKVFIASFIMDIGGREQKIIHFAQQID